MSYRVTDLTSGLLKRGCASVRHVMFDVGELRGEAVVGEGAADPAGEVASGQVVVEDIQVAAQQVAAELLQSRGSFGGPRAWK